MFSSLTLKPAKSGLFSSLTRHGSPIWPTVAGGIGSIVVTTTPLHAGATVPAAARKSPRAIAGTTRPAILMSFLYVMDSPRPDRQYPEPALTAHRGARSSRAH